MKQFPAPVWILFVGTFINKFGTFVLPFLALHLAHLGYGAGKAGLALAAYGAGHFTASLLGGHLADTIGRRKTIVLSMFSGAVAMMLLSQARTLPVVMAFGYLTGLTAECYKPASSALLADLVALEHRVTAYASYRFAINAGWAIGPAVAGFLARHSYFWLFVGDAATCVVFGSIAWLFLPRERVQAGAAWASLSAPVINLARAVRVAVRDPQFMRLVLATFAVAVVFVQMPTTLGLDIKKAGFSDSIYGLVLAINGIVVVCCEIPLSTVLRRLPARPVIAVGFSLIASGSGLNLWATRPWHFGLAMVVLTAGEICSMSVSLAYAARLAPEGMRGRYMGLYGLTWATALLCGPALGIWLFSWHRSALWLGSWALGLFGAAIVGGLFAQFRQPAPRPVLLAPK